MRRVEPVLPMQDDELGMHLHSFAPRLQGPEEGHGHESKQAPCLGLSALGRRRRQRQLPHASRRFRRNARCPERCDVQPEPSVYRAAADAICDAGNTYHAAVPEPVPER